MPTELIHWWAAYDQIRVGPQVCPLSPTGEIPAAGAVIAEADWLAAFNNVAIATVVLAFLFVLFTYETRKQGDKFRARWWKVFLLGALVIGVLSFAYLKVEDVLTFGCEYGDRMINIPTLHALGRSTVALAQGLLWFFLFSVLLNLIARWTGRRKWINNSRFPVRL